MADFTDDATELEELQRSIAIHNRPRGRPHKGCCYNCDEKLPAPMLYCDKSCGDDYERRIKNAAYPD